jgi:hypothetical protein
VGDTEYVLDRDDARFAERIQDALRHTTVRGAESPDHHSFPQQTLLDALLIRGIAQKAFPSQIRYAIFPPAARR